MKLKNIFLLAGLWVSFVYGVKEDFLKIKNFLQENLQCTIERQLQLKDVQELLKENEQNFDNKVLLLEWLIREKTLYEGGFQNLWQLNELNNESSLSQSVKELQELRRKAVDFITQKWDPSCAPKKLGEETCAMRVMNICIGLLGPAVVSEKQEEAWRRYFIGSSELSNSAVNNYFIEREQSLKNPKCKKKLESDPKKKDNVFLHWVSQHPFITALSVAALCGQSVHAIYCRGDISEIAHDWENAARNLGALLSARSNVVGRLG